MIETFCVTIYWLSTWLKEEIPEQMEVDMSWKWERERGNWETQIKQNLKLSCDGEKVEHKVESPKCEKNLFRHRK